MKDVISAIATAQGRGGVAIVRVSGEGALDIARAMFSRRGNYVPNMLYPGIIDCGTFSDHGMCVFFRAPHSFTGEDTVEFHCHGGTAIARGVLSRTFALGARPAERGEFTRRAFLNGKLSLSAAEGLADMINAESEAQVRAGCLLYEEKLTGEAREMQTLLTGCLAAIDADIDYPEEDLSADTREASLQAVRAVRERLSRLKGQYRAGRKIKDGVSVAICGRPNAGKSSLLNALLGYDKAIVSAVEGTTRDAVEGTLELNGVLFRLVDTAGLRAGADELEREGIRRAERAIRTADLIVWLREGEEFPGILPQGVPVITVAGKSDLSRREGDVAVSSVTGEGLEELKKLIYERGFGQQNDGAFLLEARHYRALERADAALSAAEASIASGMPAEVYAVEIKAAWDDLGELSGETATEAIIGEIFSRFCVGK